MQTFPVRRARWAIPFLFPLAPTPPTATVDPEVVKLRMGLHGRADIPIALIDRVGTIEWPWFAGVGTRIARGLVAFVGAPGTLVVIELSERIRLRAPLSWRAQRIAVSVEDPEGFMAAIAAARR